MNRNVWLPRIADEVSLIVAGALAANGEDDAAHWDLVQKLRHKYALPLLTEAQVQASIRQYNVLTGSPAACRATPSHLAAPEDDVEVGSATASRTELRAVVMVEAVLSSARAITLQQVQDTNRILTQLGSSLERLHDKRLLAPQLVTRIEATGYRLAEPEGSSALSESARVAQ